MATYYSPKIVTDGLVFYLDAANTKSTSNSSVWADLTESGTSLTKNGSPTLGLLGGAMCYRMTATGQSFSGSFLGTQPTTNMTIETWIYPESEVQGDDRGCIFLNSGGQSGYMSWNKGNQKMSNYWYSHPTEGYWESGAAVSRNTWNSFTCVWNYNAAVAYQWTNGIKTTSGTTQGNAATGNYIWVGQEGGSRQFAGGIAFIRVYNIALSDSQVLSNYNATKGRFGL